MALSLTNSKDIVANSITLIKGNRAIDLLETIDTIQGSAIDVYDKANIDSKRQTINTNIIK